MRALWLIGRRQAPGAHTQGGGWQSSRIWLPGKGFFF